MKNPFTFISSLKQVFEPLELYTVHIINCTMTACQRCGAEFEDPELLNEHMNFEHADGDDTDNADEGSGGE